MSRDVLKVGLACVRDGRLLLVGRRGKPVLILPGGKPERGEGEVEALTRELREETCCVPGRMERMGAFVDVSADDPDVTVTVVTYLGALEGDPVPSAEIDRVHWYAVGDDVPLAPSIVNHVVPALLAAGALSPWPAA